MRSRMPEVTVIDVPREALRYGAVLDASGAFDQLVLTAEDRNRVELYQRDAQRRELAAAARSVDEFLRALDIKVVIDTVDQQTLPRVAQLFGKTNQFNVTTRRHSPAEIEQMLAEGAIALSMRVADRYGDNGLVGVAIALNAADSSYRIDSFLMSCRVLGRGAETALLTAVARHVIARGASSSLGEFIPSKKNAPAARFFAESGFEPLPEREGWWKLDLSRGAPPYPAFLHIVDRS